MNYWQYVYIYGFGILSITIELHYAMIGRRMKDETRGQTCIGRDSITNFIVVIIIGIPKVIIFRAGNVGGGSGKDGDHGSVQPITSGSDSCGGLSGKGGQRGRSGCGGGGRCGPGVVIGPGVNGVRLGIEPGIGSGWDGRLYFFHQCRRGSTHDIRGIKGTRCSCKGKLMLFLLVTFTYSYND